MFDDRTDDELRAIARSSVDECVAGGDDISTAYQRIKSLAKILNPGSQNQELSEHIKRYTDIWLDEIRARGY